MRASLKRIVSHPELSGAALKAFTDYPTLEEITLQFLHFVPPWIVVGSESLAEKTIRNALMAYEKSKGGTGCTVGQRRYIETIAEAAKILSNLRVSVKNSNDQWDIWNYDQPLTEYMSHRKRWAIQIRERETPIAPGPVMLKLLASISSTQELESAEIDMTGLFNGSAIQ